MITGLIGVVFAIDRPAWDQFDQFIVGNYLGHRFGNVVDACVERCLSECMAIAGPHPQGDVGLARSGAVMVLRKSTSRICSVPILRWRRTTTETAADSAMRPGYTESRVARLSLAVRGS
jgi:hypothetical protein